jgi:WD40 repeat protein
MSDLDQELREMFHRHETDVIGPGSVSRPVLRRVRRRQAATVLTAIVGMAALVLGAFSIRAATGGSPQPADRGSPAPTMTLRGFGIGFSADGTRLLARSMTMNDPRGFIYDPRSGELVQTLSGRRGAALVQSFAPNGELFATGRGSPAATWVIDALTGKELWRFPGACCLGAFSPDGRSFAAPCCGIGTRVYDLATGKTVNQFPLWGVMAFSPNGKRLVISVGRDAPGEVVGFVYDTTTGGSNRPLLTLRGLGGGNIAMASAAWSPDGSMIALVTGPHDLDRGDVIVFDARTGKAILTITPSTGAESVAFDPGSSRVAVGGFEGDVTVWDVSAEVTAPILEFRAHQTEVAAIAFSPDGSRLMTGAWFENETKVWDIGVLTSHRNGS